MNLGTLATHIIYYNIWIIVGTYVFARIHFNVIVYQPIVFYNALLIKEERTYFDISHNWLQYNSR